MATHKIPSNWKNCATCSHWLGRQSADFFCLWVEYDPNERGRCVGGGFQGCEMSPMASCSSWEQRFKR